MSTAKEVLQIEYDLTQNILPSYNKVPSLEHHALIISIGYCYKKSGFIKKILEWMNSLKEDRKIGLKTWWSFEPIIEKRLRKILRKRHSNFDWKLIRSTIEFVGLQLHEFLSYNVMEQRIVKIFLKNIVFNNQGAVNIKKTLHNILRSESLVCSFENLRISCSFFLGDEIVKHFFEVYPESTQDELIASADFKDDFAFYFWIWKLTGYREKLKKVRSFITEEGGIKRCTSDINDSVALQQIFREAVESNNDIAVHYLWTHHISNLPEAEFILADVLGTSIKNVFCTNINMFLISQLNDLESFLKTNSYLIIRNLALKKRWHGLFVEVFKVLQPYLNNEDYDQILRAITKYYYKYSLQMNEEIIKNVLLALPESFKEYLLQTSDKSGYISYYQILSEPFKKWDEYLIRILLKIGNPSDTSNFLISECGADLLATLVQIGEFKMTDNLIEEFVKPDQIQEGSKISKGESKKCCRDYISLEEFKGITEFKDLFTEDFHSHYVHLKLHILYKNCQVLKEEFSREGGQFQHTEEVLLWCFDSETLCKSFKRNFIILTEEIGNVKFTFKMKVYEEIRGEILLNHFDFLSKLCDWKNSSQEEKVKLGEKLMDDSILYTFLSVKKRSSTNIIDLVKWMKYFLKISDDKLSAFKNKVSGIVRADLTKMVEKMRVSSS